jgi:hypothetical protein
MIRTPFSLIKRMTDGTGGEIRYQIEIPEQFIKQAHEFEQHKGEFFVAVGPCEDEEKIAGLMGGE